MRMSERERQVITQVIKVLREPLPQNGNPHVIVIVYNADRWYVNKAAPKGQQQA